MKMYVLAVLLAAFLCGCGQVQTMETVDDTLVEPVMAPPREISVERGGSHHGKREQPVLSVQGL